MYSGLRTRAVAQRPPPKDVAPMPGSVRLHEVGLRYPNGTEAVHGFTLDVAEGEFVAILGPSGCGKSSVLRMIAELQTPTSGSVERAPGDRTAFVFQEPNLLPWKTVFDNVALPLSLAGAPPAEIRTAVEASLARVGLSGFGEHYPRELSGGMKMRASLARAMVSTPNTLLLDEPFAALDEMTRLRLQEDLLVLQAESRLTALFVTHSVFEAVYLADRVVVTTARPARVAEMFPVELPRPRPKEIRSTSEYAAIVGRVSAVLREQQP
jgi:NitT/TauT family transport system ATP-binding protein